MKRFFNTLVLLAIGGLTLYAIDRTIIVKYSACGTSTEHIIPDGAPLTLIATPSYGYRFSQWSDGSTDNPRLLTVSGDATYTAEFEPIGAVPVLCTITTQGETCGTPYTTQIPQGVSLTLVATPSYGYRFTQWSDGNTDNPRLLTVSGDATYMAEFETIPDMGGVPSVYAHQVSIHANECSSSLVRTFAEGSILTLHATPNATCGTFLQWSDGNTDNPRSVVVTGDAAYTAVFERKQYTITATADNTEQGSVSITAE